MEFDFENGLISFNEGEYKYTGISKVMHLEEADLALGAVINALRRTFYVDFSEYPAGAIKNDLISRQHRETELAHAMIKELLPHVESGVVGWAEDITRGES